MRRICYVHIPKLANKAVFIYHTAQGVDMLRIIINGCFGRMGKAVAALASQRKDCGIVAGIDPKEDASADFPVYKSLENCNVPADAVIDFSFPGALKTLLPQAGAKKIPVVIATTGLGEEEQDLIKKFSAEIPILYSANMSLGINLLKDLVKKAASVLGPGFDIEIDEKHHRMKKDSPSGTALLLFNAINEAADSPYKPVFGRESKDQLRTDGEIGIHALRGGTIVGEHDVIFAGTEELVRISHKAYSRQVFAVGALRAAEYLHDKAPGIYTMDDVIRTAF